MAQYRKINEIARDIIREWKNVNYGAKPYLDAMLSIESIDEMYFDDPADMVVRYFLANARSFRGERAKELKAELKAML